VSTLRSREGCEERAAREHFDHACGQAGFTPKIRFRTAAYDVARTLVATGYGVALVRRLAVAGARGTARRPAEDRAQPGEPRPPAPRSTSGLPTSFSGLPSCWEIAGGVTPSRPATRGRAAGPLHRQQEVELRR